MAKASDTPDQFDDVDAQLLADYPELAELFGGAKKIRVNGKTVFEAGKRAGLRARERDV